MKRIVVEKLSGHDNRNETAYLANLTSWSIFETRIDLIELLVYMSRVDSSGSFKKSQGKKECQHCYRGEGEGA